MDDGNFEAGYNPSPHTNYTRGYLHQVFPVLFHQICKSRLQSETHPSNYSEYTAAKYETPARLSAPNTRWNVSHKRLHFFPPSSNVCGQTNFSLSAWTPILPSAFLCLFKSFWQNRSLGDKKLWLPLPSTSTLEHISVLFFSSSVFSSDHTEAQHLGKVIYVFFSAPFFKSCHQFVIFPFHYRP